MRHSWKNRIETMAAGIRRRVLAHTLARNGGYLSQACSAAELFASLYGKILKLAPFDRRLEAFGARVFRIDGYDIDELVRLGELPGTDTPTFVLCDTDPYRGMPLIRKRFPKYHYVRFLLPEEKAEYQAFYDEWTP